MTGQAVEHIENIQALGASGLTRREIAAKLDLCYEYVCQLSRQSGAKPLSKKEQLALRILELAEQGLTRAQIADAAGFSYVGISKIAKEFNIQITRQQYAGAETGNSDRIRQMAALYESGRTLNQIGQKFGITRERVRQILTKHRGFNGASGGQHAKAKQNRARFEAKRDQTSIAKWGCDWKQYAQLRAMQKPTRAYASQKRNAKKRGIDWELSLWQWWTIWRASGHWRSRGRGYGFQMCRKGDQGPYSVDNVYIASGAVNIQDYWADVKSGARPRSFTPSKNRPHVSPEHSKEVAKAASDRYRQTEKYKLRLQLRRQGLPKEQRDAIVAAQFGEPEQQQVAA